MSTKTRLMACCMVLGSLCTFLNAQQSATANDPNTATSIAATHILGLQAVGKNARGTLMANGGVLEFRKKPATTPANVSIASIQEVAVGSQDRQVGGVAMSVGKAAVPFGGGRAISLLSHKKFDTVTLEYLDGDGGFHGAIFELEKGKGEILRDQLSPDGLHGSSPAIPATRDEAVQRSSSAASQAKQWSVQVDKIVVENEVALEPAFQIAIYENLLNELTATKRFSTVFRAGDRKAAENPALLILKVTVLKYAPGSETRRSVTTVAGATKIRVRFQLCTSAGQVVTERDVDGNVRWTGGNLKATHNVSRNVAKVIKKTSLPQPASITLATR